MPKILPSDIEPHWATYERGLTSKSDRFARKCRTQIKTTEFAVKLAQRLADGKPEILVMNIARQEWETINATGLRRPNCGTWTDWIVNYESGTGKGCIDLSQIRLPGRKIVGPDYPSHEGVE